MRKLVFCVIEMTQKLNIVYFKTLAEMQAFFMQGVCGTLWKLKTAQKLITAFILVSLFIVLVLFNVTKI